MSEPLLSVVIVVYNAEATIRNAIDSVLQQTCDNIELVIIDGESNDNTIEIVKSYGDKIGYFTSEMDKGIYDAMNKGIAAAKGKWVFFLGADDVFFKNETVQTVFERNRYEDVDFLYGDVCLMSNKAVMGGSRTYYQLIDRNIPHQAIFYKRSVFRKAGNYNLSYQVLADYDLNLRVFRDEQLIKQYLPLQVSFFNNKGGVSNITIDGNFFKDQLAGFINKDGISPHDPLLQQYYFYNGIVDLFRGNIKAGLADCLRSFSRGKRKIYFILLFGKFMLGKAGIGKKVKII